MIQEKTSIHIQFFIIKFIRRFTDIFPLKHRDTFCSLRIFFCFLICFQCTGSFYHLLSFFFGASPKISGQFLFKSLGFSCGKSSGRHQGQYRAMWIVKKIFTDQFFKIPCVFERFQFLKYRNQFYLCKWMLIVIQPVSKNIKTIDQALRIGRKIGFPVAELHTVDSGIQCLAVNSCLCNFLKNISDNGNKFFFFVCIRTLCDNIKIRLTDSILISTINILADSRIKKCFLKRCPRCA